MSNNLVSKNVSLSKEVWEELEELSNGESLAEMLRMVVRFGLPAVREVEANRLKADNALLVNRKLRQRESKMREIIEDLKSKSKNEKTSINLDSLSYYLDLR